MAHENRRLLVRAVRGHEVLDFIVEEEVAGESEDAAELLGCRDA